jgi:hypothetical protein
MRLLRRGVMVLNHLADQGMSYKSLRITLQVIGTVVAVAWFLEAMTCGRGFISTYLAPFAFGPLLIAGIMRKSEIRPKN